MADKLRYKEKYRSIQLNVSRKKFAGLLQWLEYRAKNEERSFNFLIIKALLEKYERDTKEEDKI